MLPYALGGSVSLPSFCISSTDSLMQYRPVVPTDAVLMIVLQQ